MGRGTQDSRKENEVERKEILKRILKNGDGAFAKRREPQDRVVRGKKRITKCCAQVPTPHDKCSHYALQT